MAPSPLAPRFDPAVVWTGDEMLVVGGYDRNGDEFDDGAAYDPATNTWRSIASVPVDRDQRTGAGVGRPGSSTTRAFDGVWFNGEVIVYVGGVGPGFWDYDVVAYRPATDEWRTVTEARFDQLANDELVLSDGGTPPPSPETLVVAGGEVLAYGWRSDLGAFGAASLDVRTGDWGEFVAIPGSADLYGFRQARGAPVVIDDRHLVDVRNRANNIDGPFGVVLDLDANISRPILFPPLDDGEVVAFYEGSVAPSGRWVGGVVVADDEPVSEGRSFVLDPETGAWNEATRVGRVWSGDSVPTIVRAGTADVAFGGIETGQGERAVAAAVADGAEAWESLAHPGIEMARMGHAMVWTGDVVIVYGGAVVDPEGSVNVPAIALNDGAVLRLNPTQ